MTATSTFRPFDFGLQRRRYRGRQGGTDRRARCCPARSRGRRNMRYDGNYLNYLFETYPNNTDLGAASPR